jgi:hypothetical protein
MVTIMGMSYLFLKTMALKGSELLEKFIRNRRIGG